MFTRFIVLDCWVDLPFLGYQMAWRGQEDRISVVLKKRLDLPLPFGQENGASAIHQLSARFEQGPQGLKELRLNLGQLADVTFSSQPPYIGVTATNPGSRAGCVQQDGVKQGLVPPCFRLAGIGSNNLGFALQSV